MVYTLLCYSSAFPCEIELSLNPEVANISLWLEDKLALNITKTDLILSNKCGLQGIGMYTVDV